MADADNITRLVLAELRCAYLRAKLAALDIEHISDLLKCEATSSLEALMALEQLGWGSLMHAELHDMVKKAKPAARSGGKNADAK